MWPIYYVKHVNSHTQTYTFAANSPTTQVARLYVLTVHISLEINRGMHCAANRCSNSSLFISSYLSLSFSFFLTHTIVVCFSVSPPYATFVNFMWLRMHVCFYVGEGRSNSLWFHTPQLGRSIRELWDRQESSLEVGFSRRVDTDYRHCWWLSKHQKALIHLCITWGSLSIVKGFTLGHNHAE